MKDTENLINSIYLTVYKGGKCLKKFPSANPFFSIELFIKQKFNFSESINYELYEARIFLACRSFKFRYLSIMLSIVDYERIFDFIGKNRLAL